MIVLALCAPVGAVVGDSAAARRGSAYPLSQGGLAGDPREAFKLCHAPAVDYMSRKGLAEARAAVLCLINKQRVLLGLRPVRVNAAL